jgi:hypothetical protein
MCGAMLPVTVDRLNEARLPNRQASASWSLSSQTPLTLFKRLRKDGLKGAREALANWIPWIPTKQGQVSTRLQRLHTGACLLHNDCAFKVYVSDGTLCTTSQAYQQGGAFLFKGKELVWSHYDPATGAHAEPEEILAAAGL